MVSMFVLGIGVLVGGLLMARWYVDADPKTLLKSLKWAGLGIVVGGVVWLMLSGKLWAAVAVLPAVFVWFMRLMFGLRSLQTFKRMFGLGGTGAGWSSPGASSTAGGGQGSNVRTRFVVMSLHHATGQVSGEVLEGRFVGRHLEDLSLSELLALLAEAQADADSARLVESYLDRRDPAWLTREQAAGAAPGAGGASGAMTHAEALRVLGLQDGASPADVKAAHRRLMAQVHPDHGGTDFLAQQINQAKDVLLN